MSNIIMSNLQSILMAGAAILGGGAALALGFTRTFNEEGESQVAWSRKKASRPLYVALAGFLLVSAVAFVPKGNAGVIYDWSGGINQEELSEGVHFVVPFKQHVTNVDTQVHAWVFNNPDVYVHTADFHEIRVPFAINYRVKPDAAAFVLQNVSGDPADTILGHAALQSMRTEIGQIVLDDLAKSVTQIAEAIEVTIEPQATAYGLEVVYVAVEDAVVNAQFVAAVNAERISERDIRTAANKVLIAENNAREAVAKASGEAEALEILAEAKEAERSLLNMSPTEYVWFKTWNGALPLTMLGDTGDFIVNLP